jgi:N-formylglutamate deformylase
MDNNELYHFQQGNTPLLVSMPHVGTQVPGYMRSVMTPAAGQLPDTDWDVHKLYDFLPDMGVSTLRPNYSRYVVDLNRSPSGELLYPGQTETQICPTMLFNGDAIYQSGASPDGDEVSQRVDRYWKPYHQKIELELARIRQQFGYAILWDAHSIRSEVPSLFDGSLPDFNWGTADGKSCDDKLSSALLKAVQSEQSYSVVVNGRFKGGFITRHYGNPGEGIHALQLELSQATYMSDEQLFQFDTGKASNLMRLLKVLVGVTLSRFE